MYSLVTLAKILRYWILLFGVIILLVALLLPAFSAHIPLDVSTDTYRPPYDSLPTDLRSLAYSIHARF